MRLIDADALKDEKFYSHERHEKCVSVYAIDMMPTIEPRPHGEWKPDGTCSECGVYSSLNKDTAYFCPNCGADMRGKKDDLAEIIEAARNMKDGEQNEKQSRNEI